MVKNTMGLGLAEIVIAIVLAFLTYLIVRVMIKWSNLYIPAFFISLAAGIIGALLKITHSPGGQIFLVISIVLTVIYVISALSEIFNSRRISMNEKLLWLVGFIFLCTLTGFIYLFLGRPRIFDQREP